MPASIFSQLKALNQNLTLNQKLSIVTLGAVILGGVLFFAYMVQSEPYQLLFSDLDAANAKTVVDRLTQLEVPHRLGDGGKSVLVPADRVDELRIELASQDLPTVGRIGMELFDQTNWGVTEFAQKVNYKRALEGELERTILTLKEIDQTRVHLVMEKQSLFEEDAQPAKASVVVRLRGTSTLDRKHVDAIRNLVAFAVEGLTPENVTVVDVNGNLLSDSAPEEDSLNAVQLTLRRKVERELCDKVVRILEPITGEDSVRVSASVQMDFSETTEKTEKVLDPVMVSQQISRELVNTPAQQGIPFKANDPQSASAAQTASSTSANGRSLQTETTNYEVSKTVRQTVVPSGGVSQLSVAVVVDDKRVAAADGSGMTMESRSPEEMDRIRSVVSASVGLNSDRGDTLTVENISFTIPTEEKVTLPTPTFWERNKDVIYPVGRYFLVILLFLLFYLMVFRPVKKRVFAYVEVENPTAAKLNASLKDPELMKQLEQALSGDKLLESGEGGHQVLDKESAMKKELVRLAKENPQAVTHLIRSWLSEGV